MLGHNGAGKTTTINLMTGMIEKSGGEIESKKKKKKFLIPSPFLSIVYGNPLSEIDEIRSSLGVCG